MKTTFQFFGALALAVFAVATMNTRVDAAPVAVILDNTGLGASLDEIADTDVPVGPIAVPGIPGLSITVTGVFADGSGEDLNATATSLGINDGLSGDDTDAFDSDRNELATFQFNKAVTVHSLDFTTFESGDEFNFADLIIGNGDLTNGTTDVIDLGTPIAIAANTDFSLSATAGTVGIEGLSIMVVPEPSSVAILGGLGLLGFVRRRRSS